MCNRKIIFLFLIQNICCGYSKEPSEWDGSFEHPKLMLNIIDKQIFTILRWKFFVYVNLWLIYGFLKKLMNKVVCIRLYNFEHFSLFVVKLNVGYQGRNSQNACQNSKQGGSWSDCFNLQKFNLGLCCLPRFLGGQLVFEIWDNL